MTRYFPISAAEKSALAEIVALGIFGKNAVSATKYGVVADGAVDDTTNLQRALNAASGGLLVLPAGTIKFSQVTLPRNTSIRGAGMNQTILKTTATGTDAAITMSYTWGALGQQRSVIEGFTLITTASDKVAYGFSLNNVSYLQFRDVCWTYLDLAILATDAINIRFDRCMFVNNKRGVLAYKDDDSPPNSWEFNNCVLNGNSVYALDFTHPCSVALHSTNLELNGMDGTAGDSGYYGIRIQGNPQSGVHGLTVDGACYFEGNVGYADIWIECDTTDSGMHTINGATFNRVDVDDYVTNNIRLDVSNTGKTHVLVRSAFRGFNDYVEHADRRYIAVPSPSHNNWRFAGVEECYFHSSTAIPNFGGSQASAGAHVAAWVRFNGSTGAIVASHNVTSVTKNSTGNYTIAFERSFVSANHCISITTNANGGDGFLDSEAVGSVTIKTHNSAGTLTDYGAVSLVVMNKDL